MVIYLKNASMTAEIDTLGAEIHSLKDASGKEYIWQRDPAAWEKCSPLLFPAIGNSRNGKTIFEGQWYEMPKHGFCSDAEFQAVQHSDISATFTLTDSEATKSMYPYAFSLSLTYTLTEDGIFMDYLVKNQDNRAICYLLGAHPGFVCPLEENEKFEDYQLEFDCIENMTSMVYDAENRQFNRENRLPLMNNTNTLPISYPMFDNDAIYFDELKSRKVSIVHPGTRKGVEVDFSGFSSVAFWTPCHTQAPFLCVEPWNGSAICSDEDDEFIHKHDVQILNEGESREYHLGIRIL